jgi:hypothetical protein
MKTLLVKDLPVSGGRLWQGLGMGQLHQRKSSFQRNPQTVTDDNKCGVRQMCKCKDDVSLLVRCFWQSGYESVAAGGFDGLDRGGSQTP